MKIETKDKLWRVLMDLGHKCGCHQKPKRSFFYHHYQFPFCARCFGIIIGELLLGPLLLIFNINIKYYSFLLLIPLIIDGLFQHFTRYESTNFKRLITGVMAGTAVIMIIVYLIKLIFL